MCVNPPSDNLNKDLSQPPGRPPGPPCNNNDDDSENDYYARNSDNQYSENSENDYYVGHSENQYSENQYSENDYYEKIYNDHYTEHVPFDHHRYPDGQHGSMYMKPPVLPSRNRTHDRKHQKKKFSRSHSTKPNKLNLISPLPDFKLNSSHHLFIYDHQQSRADKSSAGSNHTSKHKHHSVCHLNPTSASRRRPTKKNRGGVNSSSVLPPKSISNLCRRSPTLPSQANYAPVKKKKGTKRIAKLETIPEVNLIHKWNEFVPGPVSKLPFSSVPVINSLFYNPFKYKRTQT